MYYWFVKQSVLQGFLRIHKPKAKQRVITLKRVTVVLVKTVVEKIARKLW